MSENTDPTKEFPAGESGGSHPGGVNPGDSGYQGFPDQAAGQPPQAAGVSGSHGQFPQPGGQVPQAGYEGQPGYPQVTGQQNQYQQSGASGYPTYQQVPQQGFPLTGGPAPKGSKLKDPKVLIAIAVGVLLLIGGGIAIYLQMRPNPGAPAISATTASASPSATESAEPSPSPSTTRSATPSVSPAAPSSSPSVPAPNNGTGALGSKKISEIVYPESIGAFKKASSAGKLTIYVSIGGDGFGITAMEGLEGKTAGSVLKDPESIPGGKCGKITSSTVCILDAADGALMVNTNNGDLAKLKLMSTDIVKALS